MQGLIRTMGECRRYVGHALNRQYITESFVLDSGQIQENILKYLSGSDVLKCRLLNSTWMQNCSGYLRKDNKVVLKLHRNNIELFMKNIESLAFSDFILGGKAILLEINSTGIEDEIYTKILSLPNNPRIGTLKYTLEDRPGCLENLVSLLKSSCKYYENLEFKVLPHDNSNAEILQNSLRGIGFRKLKSIKINDGVRDVPSTTSEFFADIINSSPNLKFADLPDYNGVAHSLAINPNFTLRTLSLWFHRRIGGSIDGHTLSLLFHQLAPSLEQLRFQPIDEDQVSALDSVCFKKVTYLKLSNLIVFVYASRISSRNFPALKKFDPYYHCIGVRPPHLADNEVAITSPHKSVEEIQMDMLGQTHFYNNPMGISISSLVHQFPFVTKYSIHEECSASLLLMLCSTRNPHVKEIILHFSAAYDFPQEYFTGVCEDLLPVFESELIPEDSNLRTFPSIGDIPNLEAVNIHRCSNIPYCVVRLGLIRIKKLRILRLPMVPDLSLRFMADNFRELEYLTLEKVPGEVFHTSDVEYIMTKLPDLDLDLYSKCRCVANKLPSN